MNETAIPIEVLRGDRVESLHRVSAIVVDATGASVLSAGDASVRVYPRSSIKPFQALPMIETGAADRFAITDAELALACASHSGEPLHIELALGLLDRIGLGPGDLACGPHPPGRRASADQLIRDGRAFGRQHNNCSGKHSAMLATAVHMGEPIAGYERPDHPVQRRIVEILRLFGEDALDDPPGIDGCSLPNYPMRLSALALASARLAAPQTVPQHRGAIERVVRAMRSHPICVAGTDRPDTRMMSAIPHLVTKTGAEGVYMAALLDRGLGVALKAEDGAGRASVVALLAVLDRLGVLDTRARTELSDLIQPTLQNAAGLAVGQIRVSPDWANAAT